MPLATLRPNAALPMDVSVVRQHLKQDITDDDNLIRLYLGAAMAHVEAQTGRQLLANQFRLILDSFPGPALYPGVPYGHPFSIPPQSILLPRAPLIQVRGIYYIDMAGIQQTVDTGLYVIDPVLDQARITPKFGRIWPIPIPQPGAVWVDFDAGYVNVFTADATADTITIDVWKSLAVGDRVRVSNSGGALPAPLLAQTYFIQSVIGDGVVKLSATADGAAINLTTVGTGIHYLGQPGQGGSDGILPDGILCWMLLRSDTLYGHRGENAITKGNLTNFNHADRMLDPYRLLNL